MTRHDAKCQKPMLIGSCFANIASAWILESPERPARVPSTAVKAVDCVLVAADSPNFMTVMDPISEFPIDSQDVAIILLSFRNVDLIGLQA